MHVRRVYRNKTVLPLAKSTAVFFIDDHRAGKIIVLSPDAGSVYSVIATDKCSQ